MAIPYRVFGLDEGGHVTQARHRRNLQRAGQDGHMTRTSTRIHRKGARLAGLHGHEETRQELVSHKHDTVFATDILEHRSRIFHRSHEAVIKVTQVGCLVAHGRRVYLLELVDVAAQNHMHGPPRILVVFLDCIQNSVHESRVLEDHQVRCKNQAVAQPGATLGNFLDLVYLGDSLGDRLQEELFFGRDAALGQGFLNNGNFPVDNREGLPHGKAGRGRNAYQYGTFSLALR